MLQRRKLCRSAGSLPRSNSIWAEWLQLLPTLLTHPSCCSSQKQGMVQCVSEAPYRIGEASCSHFPLFLLTEGLAAGQEGPWWCPLLWGCVWCCAVGTSVRSCDENLPLRCPQGRGEAKRAIADSQLAWCISQTKGEEELAAALEKGTQGMWIWEGNLLKRSVKSHAGS